MTLCDPFVQLCIGLSDDGSQEDDEDATTLSSATRRRGRQQGKRLRGTKRVALTLDQKVEIIQYYESTKNSTEKPISLGRLGEWAFIKFKDNLSKPPSTASLSIILHKNKDDILLRHNLVMSEKGKERKRKRRNTSEKKVIL